MERVSNVELVQRANVLVADMMYPRQSEVDTIEIGMCEVRAADSVRVCFDFHRNGWVVKQASTFAWSEDEEPDMDWQEVAFVPAWGRRSEDRE